MKTIAVLIIVLGSFDLKAQVARISRMNKQTIPTQEKTIDRRDNHGEVLKKILENNKRLNSLLQSRSGVPVIWEQGARILTGKVFRGTLLNSIVSTNLNSPVIVLAHPNQGLPFKTKFSCHGNTQNKRVLTLCHKMVTPDKEVAIQAQLLNIDGSSGLEGVYDDAKDKMIAGAVLSSFAQGMLSGAQSRIGTSFGAVRDDSVKNQVLQGLIESGKTTSDVLLDEMKTAEPIVTIDAGEEVLIYFMEAVNEM
ncbi:MAG TPA: TrbI/VirB10 family protein [Bacteriovoracaceae bacterium]|nr:TrbI/VirB10 family protein [Bacteriovoracaceae bacterium]